MKISLPVDGEKSSTECGTESRPLTAYIAPGAIGLAAQVIFAIFPVIQVWRRFDKALDRQNTAAL